MNYEEQILITDVKSEKHCVIYYVSLNQWKDLIKKWSEHTYQRTYELLKRQQSEQINQTDDDWIHSVINFTWKYHLVNIHSVMMINILYQLLKELMMYMIVWIQFLITEIHSLSWKCKMNCLTITELSDQEKLDCWFQQISAFLSLKHFIKFSQVKQWTEMK